MWKSGRQLRREAREREAVKRDHALANAKVGDTIRFAIKDPRADKMRRRHEGAREACGVIEARGPRWFRVRTVGVAVSEILRVTASKVVCLLVAADAWAATCPVPEAFGLTQRRGSGAKPPTVPASVIAMPKLGGTVEVNVRPDNIRAVCDYLHAVAAWVGERPL